VAKLSDDTWSIIGSISWIAAAAIILVGLASYASIQSELNEARATIARAESEQNFSTFQNLELAFALEQFGQAPGDVLNFCDRRSGPGAAVDVAYLCANIAFLTNNEEYIGFITLNSRAASARGRERWSEAEQAYKEALDYWDENEEQFSGEDGYFEWRKMQILEGIAYTQLHQNEAEKALETIKQALVLEDPSSDAVSGFVLSTHLKILCRLGRPEDLEGAYGDRLAAAKSRAEDRLSSLTEAEDYLRTNRQQWVETRTLDLKFFEEDKELELECAA